MRRHLTAQIRRGLATLHAAGERHSSGEMYARAQYELDDLQAALAWIEQFKAATPKRARSTPRRMEVSHAG